MPMMPPPDNAPESVVQKPEFQHDFELVVAEVLNGGFSQLWGNFHGRRGYGVPMMIARAADFARANGWDDLAEVLDEAETTDGDDSQFQSDDDPEWEEMQSELDQLDSQLYAAWDVVGNSVKQVIGWS